MQGMFHEMNGVGDTYCCGETGFSKDDLPGRKESKISQPLPKDSTPFFDVEIKDENAFDGARKLLKHLREDWPAPDISFTVCTI